jgi:hypothetical protein
MATPDRLSSGLYRPRSQSMYVAGVAIIVGQALPLDDDTLVYTVAMCWWSLVRPTGTKNPREPQFEAQYEAYGAPCRLVPACARGVPASLADRTHDDTKKAATNRLGAVQVPLHLLVAGP